MAAKRAKIQQQIAELSQERDAYLARRRSAVRNDGTLGDAVVTAVRKQLAESGFEQAEIGRVGRIISPRNPACSAHPHPAIGGAARRYDKRAATNLAAATE